MSERMMFQIKEGGRLRLSIGLKSAYGWDDYDEAVSYFSHMPKECFSRFLAGVRSIKAGPSVEREEPDHPVNLWCSSGRILDMVMVSDNQNPKTIPWEELRPGYTDGWTLVDLDSMSVVGQHGDERRAALMPWLTK